MLVDPRKAAVQNRLRRIFVNLRALPTRIASPTRTAYAVPPHNIKGVPLLAINNSPQTLLQANKAINKADCTLMFVLVTTKLVQCAVHQVAT